MPSSWKNNAKEEEARRVRNSEAIGRDRSPLSSKGFDIDYVSISKRKRSKILKVAETLYSLGRSSL